MVTNDSDDSDWTPNESYVPLRKRTKRVEISGKRPNDDIHIMITRSKYRTPKAVTEQLEEYPKNESLAKKPFKVKNFQDLFRLSQVCFLEKKMFKDCQRLPKLHGVLVSINNIVGLTEVKNAIARMIMYELRTEQMKRANVDTDPYWRHMVITGPPGTGKTMVANLIAKVLKGIGVTNEDGITIGNTRNMISGWMGQTKDEVNSMVNEALSKSGVLFIDEAPSLNDGRQTAGGDQYGKSCLNTLMELMDEHKEKLVVILAGYYDEMEQNVMGANEGMRRRIQWWFHIEQYSAEELFCIFQQQLAAMNFQLPTDSFISVDWFKSHIEFFPFFGGSVRNFTEKIKTEALGEMFGESDTQLLTDEIIQEGYNLYKNFSLDPGLRSPGLTANCVKTDECETLTI